MQSLGTFSSWVRDGALAGIGLSLGGWGIALCIGLSLYGEPNWSSLLIAIAVCTICGALLGPTLGAAGWWAARRGALLVMLAAAIGTVLGAVLAASLSEHAIGRDIHLQRLEYLLIVAFGLVTALPPVAAYVLVRSRGRSGLPVVLGSVLWLIVPVALAFVGGEML